MQKATKLILALAIAWPSCLYANGVPEPDDYRMEEYHDPVPETLSGAVVVDVEQAHQLWLAGETVFVDVFPQPPKPENLPEGTLWIERPRVTIEGAFWLPNTGYGRAPIGMDAYLKEGLSAATAGDLAKPRLVFCRANCWMSWNAARRAMLELGYQNVFWFPDGMDAWSFEELPTEKKKPWAR